MIDRDLGELIKELRRTLGPRGVISEPDALRTYDADASMIVARAPQLVALPASPEQAAAVVRLAAAARLPVVARGAGTGIAGGAVPVHGGVLLSTARLAELDVGAVRGRTIVVGAGVVNAELNAALAPLGLQFAPDPSSQRASTIGGNLATNAGGPHCLKHGVTTNHVRAVEIVRPDGALLWTGDGAPDAAGYDLTGLVVGSEGTFGLATRALLRLTRLPEANRVVLALFPSVVAASAAVSRVIAAGSLPTSLEVMDHNAIRAVNGAYGLGLPEDAGTTLLIVEVDGVEDGLDEALEEILAICREQGAFELRPARSAAEQARVWVARKSVAGAIGRLAPAYLLVDTVVPRTRLPMMMEQIERLRREHAMEVCNVFHAGDGNLHPLVLYDPRDPEQSRRAHAIAKGVLELSIAEGGVISGEHGIGVEKQNYLPLLFSPAELQLQAAVYHVFNPADSFNPAKIFPAAARPAALAAERALRLQSSRETGRPGDRETGRPGDGETGRPGDGETGRPGDGETGRPGDRETESPASETVRGTRSVSAGLRVPLSPGLRVPLSPGLRVPLSPGLRLSLSERVGAEYVLSGEAAAPYALHGVVPDLMVLPGSVGELSAVMAACHRAGAAVLPWGGGTRQSAGGAPAAGGRPLVVVGTGRLRGVLQYEPDDLTIGVEAGVTLAELGALLAANGQMLPLDAPLPERATVGGLAATAAEGPRREGYGLMRDWVLALTVVEPDGVVVRLGAQVVKNVTGYDLVKLYVGSHGTLGVIAAVSLRVFPRPRASATALVGLGGSHTVGAFLDALAASSLQPTAVELLRGLPALPGAPAGHHALAVRAEGHPAAVERHISELAGLAERVAARFPGHAAPRVLRGADEAALWHAIAAHAAHTAAPDEALIRVAHAPGGAWLATLNECDDLAEARGLALAVAGRALSGVLYIRARGPAEPLAAFCRDLDQPGRHVHLLAGPAELPGRLPPWGRPPAALALMRELKSAIDPHAMLSPGRFVV